MIASDIADVTSLRTQLWHAGFRPVPVFNADADVASPGKQPLGKAWQMDARRDPPFCATSPAVAHAMNSGILCDGLRPIDFDIDDQDIARQCCSIATDMFGEAPIRMRKGSPRCLMLYRAAAGEPSKIVLSGRLGKIEVLGRGQQFVAFGMHPSGAELEWSPDAPGNEPRDALPAVTEDEIADFLATCAPIIDASPPSRANGQDHAPGEPQADTLRIAAALASIPNGGPPDWEWWNRVGMAVWRATGGSSAGWEAWNAWSARNGAYDPDATRARWNHYATSPPTSIGAGTIFRMAAEAGQEADAGLITEGSVADAFARQHRDRLRYDHHVGKWFLWDGTRWRREETKLAYRWAHQKAKTLAADTDNAKAILGAGKAAFAAGVERLAQSDRDFAVTSDTWDPDPWLLGTPGGTVDLRTGKMRPVAREDHITKLAAVAPADTADCPLWLKFLNEATRRDAGLIRFLQQWCGYSLTGSIEEHALLFIHGDGGNGKGVWLNTISNIMADYCRTAAMDTFIASKNDRHPTDLAALKGARMVCASETEEGRAWSEVRIKQLTGGDRIAARFMRQDFFEFTPQFKLTVIGNHMPELHNVDDASRRRINMAPFTHKPPVVDKKLEKKLRVEWPGILRWMIDGCLDWQANGLIRPAIVAASTADYFSDQDLLAQWIEECCERTDEDGSPAKDTLSSLLASWRTYANNRGEAPGGSKGFSMAMRSRGFSRFRNEHGIRGRGFLGIRVRVQYFEPGA